MYGGSTPPTWKLQVDLNVNLHLPDEYQFERWMELVRRLLKSPQNKTDEDK